jgi:soluble lytic murein transglycosylase-like protein
LDIESESRTPTKRLFRGTFSIALFLLLTVFPYQVTYKPTVQLDNANTKPLNITVKEDSVPHGISGAKKGGLEHIFNTIIVEAANRHKIDPALVKAIIMVESRYNPQAVSKKGAVGLMQIMPATALELGVTDLFDPELNINTGVRYLKKLLKQFDGDLPLAVAAYNAGSTKVKEYQGVPPYKATQRYVKKVIEYYEYYQNLHVTTSNAV